MLLDYHGRGGKKSSSTTTKKKSLSDYMYYLKLAKQASNYETAIEYLINYICKTFAYGNNIGTALDKLEAYDVDQHKPRLTYSMSANKKVKEAQNRQFEIEFKAKYDTFIKWKSAHETNQTKAYVILNLKCSTPYSRSVTMP